MIQKLDRFKLLVIGIHPDTLGDIITLLHAKDGLTLSFTVF